MSIQSGNKNLDYNTQEGHLIWNAFLPNISMKVKHILGRLN